MRSLRERRSSRRGCIAFSLSLILGGLADADAAPARRAAAAQCPAGGTESVFFVRAIDGQIFVSSEGSEIRLAGVLAAGAGGETLSDAQGIAARTRLAEALQTGPLNLAEVGRDRYGRILGHVFARDAPVARTLLRAGALRVAPDPQSGPCVSMFLEAEGEARSARAGHWGDGIFNVFSPEKIRGRLGSFQIVEGIVVSAAQVKGRVFINFGADYRTDFTVTVAPTDMQPFRAAKFDVKALAGKRVRGWVELYNGTEMEIATPGAIEIIAPVS